MINFIRDVQTFEEYKVNFLKNYKLGEDLPNNIFNDRFKYFLATEHDFMRDELFFEGLQRVLMSTQLNDFTYYTISPSPDKFFEECSVYSTIKLSLENTDDDFSEFLMTDFNNGKHNKNILYCDLAAIFSDNDDWAIIGAMEWEFCIVGFTSLSVQKLFLSCFQEDADVFVSVREEVEMLHEMLNFKPHILAKYNKLIENYSPSVRSKPGKLP